MAGPRRPSREVFDSPAESGAGSEPNPIRIAYFSNFSPRKLGSGEDRIVQFARMARARGHSFTLFGRTPVHPDVSEALAGAGAAWRPLDELEGRPFRAGRRLAREFDVLELNMIAPRSSAALAAYLAIPAVVLFVERVSGPPVGEEGRRTPLHWLADHATMMRVRQVAGITEYVRHRAQRRFGLPRDRTCTIYNGVDTSRFRPATRVAAPSGPLRILAVASLIREKGIDVLLRAAARMRHRNRVVRVVGVGPERTRLDALVDSLGIASDVAFLGLRDDVPELMRDADVFVHPAIWQEALGNVVLEAMASGLYTIASRVGGIPELMTHEVEGVLVDAGDVEGLAAALDQAAVDPEARGRFGAAARSRVERDFTLERSLIRHLDWCETVASGRHRRA